MNIHFKTGKVQCEDNIRIPSLARIIKNLSDILHDLHYSGTLRKSNSLQLNMNFDDVLFRKLSVINWSLEKTPKLNMPVLGEKWGNQEVDLIISSKKFKGRKAVIEIEKGNKKTLWFDFIKMWMFMEAKKADFGILICSVNYAHRHGEWNLFDDALKIKKYLECFAGVSKNKLNRIGIVGYKQLIKDGRKYKDWNKDEFKKVKNIT